MARAFASLTVLLILAGAALGVNGLLGTDPGQRLASRCSFAGGGQSCQTGRSGYGIDDVALNEPGSSERKARKRSLTTAKKAPADAAVPDAGPRVAVADGGASAAPPAGAVATAPDPAAAKPVEAPAPAREITTWKDPVAPLAPTATAVPAVPDQGPKTATIDPARPEFSQKRAEPKAQARPEAPVRATEPNPEPRSEPRVRTAEPKAPPAPPRIVAEAAGRTRQPIAREAEKADRPEKASAPRVAEAPKARRRVVTRAVRPREPATELASLSPPPPKVLEVAPARKPEPIIERPARRASVAPRRILRQAPVPAPLMDEVRVRVGVASAAPVPPRPVPDRSGGSSAFPSDFQAALRQHNARYSMYSGRRPLPWLGDDD